MAYQLGDLITSIRLRAKDSDFSEALITDHLNATQNEVLGHRRYTFMEGSDSDTLPSGQSDIQLETDVSLIDYLAIEVDGDDQALDYERFREFFTPPMSLYVGRPSKFTIHGDTLYFNAEADQSYTINYKYLMRPATLTNSADVPSIPESYKEILIRGALAGIEEYRENFDIAGLHRRKIEELSEDMNLRYGLRQTMRAPGKSRRSFRRASF